MVTLQSSTTEKDSFDRYLNIASHSHYGKKLAILNLVEDSSKWDKIYRKDKFFRLYTPDYRGWRYTIHGDDLASVTSELTLRWPHIVDEEEEEEYHWQRRFCELAAYLEREGLLSQ